MDTNLTLSAQILTLAPNLQHSESINGLLVVKNVTAKTYLKITTAQWRILRLFGESRSVPAVLAQALDERLCLPLNEFFELILKAVRANILLEPGVEPEPVQAFNWRPGVRPKAVARPLALIFLAGLVMMTVYRPGLPLSAEDVGASLLILSLTLTFSAFLNACMVRGAGGEIYRPRWLWLRLPPYFEVDTGDAVMLSTLDQQAIAMARPAVLAAVAGLVAWLRPEWDCFLLIALAIVLRPILGGRFAALVRLGRKGSLSDADHAYIFPPNKRSHTRWRLLRRSLRHRDTWVLISYGVMWTLAVVYMGARVTNTPPWPFATWEDNSVRLGIAIGASLVALGMGYGLWEFFHFARERARARRHTFRLWKTRWFTAKKLVLLEGNRLKSVTESPLFRTLQPPERQQLARLMHTSRHGPWSPLPTHGPVPTQVSLIVSGTVGLYRKLPSGRSSRVQILSEGDVIGLHDLADPKQPSYVVRSLTPVTLLTLDRSAVEAIAIPRIARTVLTDTILKLPFLRRISLCQNWHFQAIERFAHLSSITDYSAGGVIFPENEFNENFFIIFEQDAIVTRNNRRLATIHAGDFFGEIGLLQNSASNAQVSAKQDMRCLSISRVEFLRFVTHNNTVALELERVSSKRLGRPIFPLKKGNFRST
ncbi:MAG: cyclic nucleotide-binding domain-containing protein [Opitutaceae bacterium]